MDLSYSEEEEEFRAGLRAWLARVLPTLPPKPPPDDWPGRRAYDLGWQRMLYEAGYAGLHWAKDAGGQGATPTQHLIFLEETERAGAPYTGANFVGLLHAGPTIAAEGTPEQRRRWLPPILRGDEVWCQGFSEPEAGSDLANLRTLAVADPNPDGTVDYVIDGQKTWTSSAHMARWGLFLVRTDPTAIERDAKHEGITALIIDMHVPGIECRPIRDLTGEEMFCEVFFTGARIPQAYRLGDEGAGWQVAMGTLGHERVGTSGLAISMKADLDAMINAAKAENPDALRDPELRERIARAYTDIEYTRLLNYRALSKILKGEPNWPEVPIAKLQWSHLAQTLAELACDLFGPSAILGKGAPGAIDNGSWNRLYLFQRYTSIGAGTTEVQKNLIADRAIKLPRK